MEWISVKERLPELEEKVLVSSKSSLFDYEQYMYIAELQDYINSFTWWQLSETPDEHPLQIIKGECNCKLNDCGLNEVTHWMTLPLPPVDLD